MHIGWGMEAGTGTPVLIVIGLQEFSHNVARVL